MSELGVSSIDLSERDLSGTNWVGADVRNVTMAGSNLKGANFERAKLVSVDLAGANLWGVNFWRARLRSTSIEASILLHTNFWNTEGAPDRLEQAGIISFGDYGEFFNYFRNYLGMSKADVGRTFAWVKNERFSGMLAHYFE